MGNKKNFVINRKQLSKLSGKIVIGIAALFIVALVIEQGLTAAKETYAQTLEGKSRETYEFYYENAFDAAERKYHVSNEAKISVEKIREEAELEVLQVSDIEYVIREDNRKSWTAIRGHGVYTVDLEMSEFIIDNERQYVLARIPEPGLNIAGLDYEYENYLFESGIFNGTISEGVDRAMEDLKTAQNRLQAKLLSTQVYFEMAEESARALIEGMIRNLNPGLPGLIVEVEFTNS